MQHQHANPHGALTLVEKKCGGFFSLESGCRARKGFSKCSVLPSFPSPSPFIHPPPFLPSSHPFLVFPPPQMRNEKAKDGWRRKRKERKARREKVFCPQPSFCNLFLLANHFPRHLHYSPERPPLHLRCERERNEERVTVRSHGSPVDKLQLAKRSSFILEQPSRTFFARRRSPLLLPLYGIWNESVWGPTRAERGECALCTKN